MGLLKILFILSGVLLAVLIGYNVKVLLEDAPVPVLPKDVWWGKGERLVEDNTTKPFKIQVPPAEIQELKERLDRFLNKPITPPLENIAFEYGFNTDYLQGVIKFWRDYYNWPDRQKYLNSMPQYTINVNGLKVHYIRVTPNASEGRRVLPLLLLHGWPGSVREFYDIIPLLTQPNNKTDFVFEVIAPSLPGYGFSEAPAKPGMGPAEMAVVLNNLMEKLGFKKYYAQGGDWGARLAKNLGILYPENILGVHSNMCHVLSKLSITLTFLGSIYPRLIVEKEHEHLMYPLQKIIYRFVEESAYSHIHGTKPDTIGVALSDTPTGLAAFILEKFSSWTNFSNIHLPDGGLTKVITLEALVDNVMIYWISNSITTSQRLYSEAFTFKEMALKLDETPITVPTACARFAHDITWSSEKILKLQHRNLVHVSDFPNAGHFAAWEVPKELANDIIVAINKMEKLQIPN